MKIMSALFLEFTYKDIFNELILLLNTKLIGKLNRFTPSNIALPVLILALAFTPRSEGHEDQHTHAELSVAAAHFLNSSNIANEEVRLGWAPGTVAESLRQGSIDEDKCPLYANHFYNPAAPGQLIDPAKNWQDINCSYYTDKPNYPPDPNYNSNDPVFSLRIDQQSAVERASDNWDAAVRYYRDGKHEEAYLLLGHVFHLMQDMTSPAHVHNDPHGKARLQGGDGACFWQQDADDFENWGWCRSDDNAAAYRHIFDYLETNGSVGPDGTNIRDRARIGLERIYENKPQFATPNLGENSGHAFVRHVAEVTFDFSTFTVKLRDENFGNDTQPASQMKYMFPGLSEGSGDEFYILYGDQDIGYSEGHCGRWEGGLDFNEEWWPMENSPRWPCSRTTWGLDNTETLNGWAYIENSGGNGPRGKGNWDSLVPSRYFKDEYLLRYDGSYTNNSRKTLLRIYGDILYPTAIAYGAGLLQMFTEEVMDLPVANAGGPYASEGCLPIVFDASGSFDSNADGSITSYSWDFEDDGVIDITTGSPIVEHYYPSAHLGLARLMVTDNDGFTDEATTYVAFYPDLQAPVIESVDADPNSLWPPNNKMVPVTVSVEVTDHCGASCMIVEVTHNETGLNKGDNKHLTDWNVTGDLQVELRAERFGKGNGRIYEIGIQCSDPAGQSSLGETTVSVPHDAR